MTRTLLALLLASTAFLPAARAQSPAPAAPPAAEAAAPGTAMVTVDAERLEDLEIRNARGDEIGEVDDVMVGPDGKGAVVVEFGGFLGIGERKVLLPLERLTMNGDALVLDGTDEDLRRMPAFDRSAEGFRQADGSFRANVRVTQAMGGGAPAGAAGASASAGGGAVPGAGPNPGPTNRNETSPAVSNAPQDPSLTNRSAETFRQGAGANLQPNQPAQGATPAGPSTVPAGQMSSAPTSDAPLTTLPPSGPPAATAPGGTAGRAGGPDTTASGQPAPGTSPAPAATGSVPPATR